LTFAAWWIVVFVALFSLARVKLVHYIAPVFPAAALLVGAWADGWLARAERDPALVRIALAILCLTGLGAGVVLLLLLGPRHGVAKHFEKEWLVGAAPLWMLAVVAAGSLGGAVLAFRRVRLAALACLAVMAMADVGLSKLVLEPRVALVADAPKRELALMASRQLAPHGRLAIYQAKFAATVFYYRGVVTDLNPRSVGAVAGFLRATPRAAVITRACWAPLLTKRGTNVLWASRHGLILVGNCPAGAELRGKCRRSH
jgi:4-amino-4-deoxy-L-arabinose transferase-like glycosyltransferase